MAGNGNEFLPNYVEYMVPLTEGKYVWPKRLGVGGLIVFLVLALIVLVSTVANFLAGLVPVFLIGIAFLGWYLWRFVAVEYEYTILQGEISFDVIYGRRQRKHFYTAKISDMEIISPLKNGIPQIPGITREVFAASSYSNPNTRYAVVKEENGGKTLLFFETFEKAEKAMRFYNSRAFLGQ